MGELGAQNVKRLGGGLAREEHVQTRGKDQRRRFKSGRGDMDLVRVFDLQTYKHKRVTSE